MRAPVVACLVAVGCAALLAACAGAQAPDDGPSAPTGAPTPGAGEYREGQVAAVDLPDDPRAVVVLVPGGAWATIWDPAGFGLLADSLAERGLAVVQITYGTSATDTYYPQPADDVACAVAYAAEQVPGVPVVTVGHSAGAVLAVLTGLAPDRDDPGCPYPGRAADGVVGLAGPYDVDHTGIGENLFGVPESEDPDLWADGNPFTWVDERPDLPVLLAHGEADSDVPLAFTEDMAAALEGAGHPVTVEVLPGQNHNDMYRPEVVTDLITAWVDDAVVGPAG